MKRKLKWLAIVVAVSLLGFGTALFLWPRDRITAESYAKIRLGMKEKEVEKILGGPAISSKEFSDRWKAWGKPLTIERVTSEGEVSGLSKKWWDRRGIMEINFDQGGRVVGKWFLDGQFGESTFIDRLRDWLGW